MSLVLAGACIPPAAGKPIVLAIMASSLVRDAMKSFSAATASASDGASPTEGIVGSRLAIPQRAKAYHISDDPNQIKNATMQPRTAQPTKYVSRWHSSETRLCSA